MADHKRIHYIDVAKGIAMLWVILGHVNIAYTFANGGNGPMPAAIDIFGASFHMPLFFILTGMTAKQEEKTFRAGWTPVFQRRIRQLLTPYALWTLIFCTALAPNQFVQSILYIAYGNNKTISMADTMAVLWFLPVMFLATMLFHGVMILCNRIEGKRRELARLMIFVVFLLLSWWLAAPDSTYGYPFGADVALSAASFMYLGYCVRKNADLVMERAHKRNVFLFCIGSAVGVWFLAIFNNQFIAREDLGKVVMAWGNYGLYPLFLITAILGSFCMLGLSILLSKSRALRFVGKNTLVFLSIHYSFMVVLSKALYLTGWEMSSTIGHIGCVILISLSGIIGSALIAPLVNRYFPNLTGK